MGVSRPPACSKGQWEDSFAVPSTLMGSHLLTSSPHGLAPRNGSLGTPAKPEVGVGRRIMCAGLGLFAVLSLSPPALDAQTAREWLMNSWETGDGLPQNSVIAMTQDSVGYLWLATFDGIVRFDGVRFEVFRTASTPGLPSNQGQSMANGPDGSIWMGAGSGGLVRWAGERFEHLAPTALGIEGYVDAVTADPSGRIWFSTGPGALWVLEDGQARRVAVQPATFETHPPGTGGDTWVIFYEDLFRVVGDEAFVYSGDDPALTGGAVISTLRARDGALWVGTAQGLSRLADGGSRRYRAAEGLPHEAVWAIVEEEDGTILVGTRTGLVEIRDGSVRPFREASELDRVWIRSMMHDRQGNLWVGTDGAGLHQVRRARFRRISVEEGLTDPLALSIHKDASGALWVGTNCGGVNRVGAGGVTALIQGSGIPNECVWSVNSDPDGTLWFGTWGNGIARYRDGVFRNFEMDDGLSDDRIVLIHRDRSGVLWVGTLAGLNRMEGDGFTEFPIPEHPGVQVLTVLEDPEGPLWFGTDRGLLRVEGDEARMLGTADGIRHPVRALHRDASGAIWLGTWGGGLLRMKDESIDSVSLAHGLPEDGISHILEDDFGYFWMGTNRGVYRVARSDLDEVIDGGREDLPFRRFAEDDGLPSAETNGGFYPSAIRDDDGTLWFPTIRGVAGVRPDLIVWDSLPPPVVIERIVADGVEMEPGGEVVLPAGAEIVEIHFTALSLSVPDGIQFRYRMEGLTRDWTDVGARRVAYFSTLPPGNFTFEVVAANPDGVWSEEGATIQITQRPMWHDHPAVRILLLTALVLMILQVVRVRMDAHVIRAKELEAVILERTEELWERKEALEDMNVDLGNLVADLNEQQFALEEARLAAESASRAKSSFLATMSHELRTPLNSVIGFSSILKKRAADRMTPEDISFLERINTNGHHLLHLINEILDLSKVEAGKVDLEITAIDLGPFVTRTVAEMEGRTQGAEVRLSVEVPEGLQPLLTDPRRLKQILINLVGNALKFTPRGSVTVRVVPDASGRVPESIEVEDTGVGIPADRLPYVFDPFEQGDRTTARRFGGTGLGLALSRALAELLGFGLEGRSEEGVGSVFRLRLSPEVEERGVRGKAVQADD